MEIKANWAKPFALKEGRKADNYIYHLPLEYIPDSAGCYVFYNQHGKSATILYIGRAENLKKRLEQQLNYVKLMMGVKNSVKGTKHVIYCKLNLRPGQQLNKVLKILESNLIKTALSNGHELLNKQGTRKKYNHISFSGNRESESMFGRRMSVEI